MYEVLAFAVGSLVGLLGGGGSVLTVPLLVFVVGLEPRAAIGSSLLLVGLTSATAAAAHARNLRLRLGLPFAATSAASAFVGGRLAQHVKPALLLGFFVVLMVATGAAMLRARAEVRGSVRPARAALVGGAVGLLTGMVGAGGGFVVVPALALFCGLTMPEAIATSVFVVALNALAGFASYVGKVSFDMPLLARMTLAACAGSVAGARLSSRVPALVLRRVFAVLVLAVATFMAVRLVG